MPFGPLTAKLTAKPMDSHSTQRTPADNTLLLTSTDGRQRTRVDTAAMTTDQKVGCSSHPERAEFPRGQPVFSVLMSITDVVGDSHADSQTPKGVRQATRAKRRTGNQLARSRNRWSAVRNRQHRTNPVTR